MKKMTKVLAFVGSVLILSGLASVELTMAESETIEGISEAKKAAIINNCDDIHERLVTLQHSDSRARVYLGRHYEIILTDFIKPLNVWLVGHSKSDVSLVENQKNFEARRDDFVSDYIKYQKELEDLVAIDCKVEPGKFYDKLVSVREKRAIVQKDVTRLKRLMNTQTDLVTNLKENI